MNNYYTINKELWQAYLNLLEPKFQIRRAKTIAKPWKKRKRYNKLLYEKEIILKYS